MSEPEWEKHLKSSDSEERKRIIASLLEQLQIDGGDTEIRKRLEEGWQLITEGNAREALAIARQITSLAPDLAEGWALLARGKAETGLANEAVVDLKRAITLEPDNPILRHDLGLALHDAGEFAEAIEQFQTAAKFNPEEPVHRAALGRSLLTQGKLDDGIRVLKEIVREVPDNPDYKKTLAAGYMEKALNAWTYVPAGENVPEGWYAISKEQVDLAEANIENALSLEFSDPELRHEIENQKKVIASNRKRMFNVPWTGRIAAGIYATIGLIFLSTEGLGGIIQFLYFTGGGLFYLYAVRAPQYLINRQVLGRWKQGVGDQLLDVTSDYVGRGTVGGKVMGITMFLLLPFVGAYRFYQNYIKT